MTPEIADTPQHYDAAAAAARYGAWQEALGLYRAEPQQPGKAYAVMMPPPNVTGSLHMGHALNNTLQDVLVRYKKMCGYNVLWVPGVDHASIAVHWVLERALQKQHLQRQDLGRSAFLSQAWAFKEATQATIVAQQRRLGIAADWSRHRFTMDAGLSTAVREAFVRLYEDGLIYRAKQLVNWDPQAQTSVSDLEIVYDEQVQGELHHFAYRLADKSGELVVATTRPETLLGDTALAVHPDDKRYQALIGQHVVHPLRAAGHAQYLLPIVADAQLVDPSFGTGVVKVTPAHSFDDFALATRHNLPLLNILEKNGCLNAACGAFAGLSVTQGRQAVLDKLASLGLARGSQPHTMRIGRAERSGAVLEPLLSWQWYVRAKPLRTPALSAVQFGFSRFIPQSWQNTYFAWLGDIRDWCISRQLWWGHRIPAWHCQNCQHITVAREDPHACAACESPALQQDEDILDTWFSSALWPFSTLGWPAKTAELQRYYPTAVLITGFDIIFFWVARMMMLGQHLLGQVPFHDIYIHALIRDAEGEKMSKSKGNVVDPLVMIDTYGLDAFRFTLVALAGHGRDVRWEAARAAGYHKFVNKIWQAWRFVANHLNLDAQRQVEQATPPSLRSLPAVYERWIIAALGECVRAVHAALETYRFSEAAAVLYSFVWETFCDWYLEISKMVLYDDNASVAQKHATCQTLQEVFAVLSRLLQPFMPFLSEELWQRLVPYTTTAPAAAVPASSVLSQAYPQPQDFAADVQAVTEMAVLQSIVAAVRRVRADYNLKPKQLIHVLYRTSQPLETLVQRHTAFFLALAKAQLQPTAQPPSEASVAVVLDAMELWVPLNELVDSAAENARLHKELDKITQECSRLQTQLSQASFLARAPAAIVAEKRQALAAAAATQARLQAALARQITPAEAD